MYAVEHTLHGYFVLIDHTGAALETSPGVRWLSGSPFEAATIAGLLNCGQLSPTDLQQPTHTDEQAGSL